MSNYENLEKTARIVRLQRVVCKGENRGDRRKEERAAAAAAIAETIENYMESVLDELAALSAEIRELGNKMSAL